MRLRIQGRSITFKIDLLDRPGTPSYTVEVPIQLVKDVRSAFRYDDEVWGEVRATPKYEMSWEIVGWIIGVYDWYASGTFKVLFYRMPSILDSDYEAFKRRYVVANISWIRPRITSLRDIAREAVAGIVRSIYENARSKSRGKEGS